MSYFVPQRSASVEYEVKKSRFIAYAHHVHSREEAISAVDALREKYPDARHHCWAYLIGSPHSPTTVAMNDDGEPSGTAGKPILNVLQHKDVGDIIIVVVRYFGGIKLGAGGLVRAYSHSAQMVMDVLELEQRVELEAMTLEGDFAVEQSIRHWLDKNQGLMNEVEYSQRVTMHVQIKPELKHEFIDWLNGVSVKVKSTQ